MLSRGGVNALRYESRLAFNVECQTQVDWYIKPRKRRTDGFYKSGRVDRARIKLAHDDHSYGAAVAHA